MRSLHPTGLKGRVVVIDADTRFHPLAVIPDKLAQNGHRNAPLGRQVGERESASMEFVAEQFAEAAATTGRMVGVLLLNLPPAAFDERFFVLHKRGGQVGPNSKRRLPRRSNEDAKTARVKGETYRNDLKETQWTKELTNYWQKSTTCCATSRKASARSTRNWGRRLQSTNLLRQSTRNSGGCRWR